MPITVVTGSGRCGTKAISKYLNGLQKDNGSVIDSRHETERDDLLTLIQNGDMSGIADLFMDFTHDIEVSPYYSLLNKPIDQIRVIAIIRDGRETVTSAMNSGWFFKEVEGQYEWWEALDVQPSDRFTMCCKTWTYVYSKLKEWNAPFYRLEDLISNEQMHRSFLEEFGISEAVVEKNITKTNIAQKRKQRLIDRGVMPIPRCDHWSDELNAIFDKECGELMLEYYSDRYPT